MKKSKDADPIRWRALPPSRSEIETEMGAATRLLGADEPPDEVRLAQIRQRVLPQLRQDGLGGFWFVHPWLRVVVLVIASLTVGGVATAITGRLIEKYRRADTAPAAPAVTGVPASKRVARRWRIAVKTPTELDLSVGPDGTDVNVLEGQAEISIAGVPGVVRMEPGASWRSSAPAVEAPPAAAISNALQPVRSVPPSSAHPVASGPANSVVQSRAIPSLPRPRPLLRNERSRTLALAEVERSSPPNPSVSPSLNSPSAAPTPPADPPGFEPFRVETPRISLPNSTTVPSLPPSEAALLGRALRRLRADRDPRGALVQLDEHDRRFPSGALAREATLARVEALLALDRKATALAILDALNMEGATVDRRAALARAELRAGGGRRKDAIADFDMILESDSDDDISARALFGRAVLNARAGDAADARDDLREYLRRFADGPRRFDSARMLRRLGG